MMHYTTCPKTLKVPSKIHRIVFLILIITNVQYTWIPLFMGLFLKDVWISWKDPGKLGLIKDIKSLQSWIQATRSESTRQLNPLLSLPDINASSGFILVQAHMCDVISLMRFEERRWSFPFLFISSPLLSTTHSQGMVNVWRQEHLSIMSGLLMYHTHN